MRLLSYILVILGICLLSKAAYDQYRGITTAPAVLAREQVAGIVKTGEITRQTDPDDFRVAMACRWFLGLVSAFAGISLYLSVRRQDRLDPFSPDFEIRDKE